jgi:hypothetical protein
VRAGLFSLRLLAFLWFDNGAIAFLTTFAMVEAEAGLD